MHVNGVCSEHIAILYADNEHDFKMTNEKKTTHFFPALNNEKNHCGQMLLLVAQKKFSIDGMIARLQFKLPKLNNIIYYEPKNVYCTNLKYLHKIQCNPQTHAFRHCKFSFRLFSIQIGWNEYFFLCALHIHRKTSSFSISIQMNGWMSVSVTENNKLNS